MKIEGTNNIETPNLLLRRFTMDDVEQVNENWGTDKEVSKYVTWFPHKDLEETKFFVNLWVEGYNNKYTYRWGVVEKETNTLFGIIDVINENVDYKICEVGYCYGSKWWGKGYATQALTEVIKYLHDAGFVVVEARHFEDNLASGRVMEKSGMKFEAKLKSRVIDKNNQRQDIMVYSSIMEEL